MNFYILVLQLSLYFNWSNTPATLTSRRQNHVVLQIDYLRNVRSTGQPAEMLVMHSELPFIRNYLDHKRIPNKITMQNITKQVIRERRALLDAFRDEITLDVIQKSYLSFDDQMSLLFQLGKQFPHFVNVWQIATSSEGRQIYAVKIGYPSYVNKPILWIDAGIHAREWISHSTALNIIWQLIYDSNHRTLIREIDIIVVPNVNPDGYEYSRKSNRMWRKTRSKSPVSRFSEQCSGVDANRNYPFHFGEEGVSHWPCQ
ncbi:zinc carboxypeptidase [Dictyocaulus viviparus]|uniref:Zinc carboxypeptidase n=1 Tax=Dictyocaulus viviparus TaxID=29172 RepID=A0A0D8XT58_DICVI|nr:zinc carboxypeptidase [Dictyocaulus viviparus]